MKKKIHPQFYVFYYTFEKIIKLNYLMNNIY